MSTWGSNLTKDKSGVEVGRQIVEDRLVLKRNIQDEAEEACDYRPIDSEHFCSVKVERKNES